MGCDMSLPDRVPTYADLPVVDDAPPKSAWGVFGRDDQLGTLNFLDPRAATGRRPKRAARRGLTTWTCPCTCRGRR